MRPSKQANKHTVHIDHALKAVLSCTKKFSLGVFTQQQLLSLYCSYFFLIFIFSPRHPSRLHPVGQCDVVAPDVELPLPEADDAAEDVAGVHAYTHVDVGASHLPDSPDEETFVASSLTEVDKKVCLLDGLNHLQPHVDAVARMLRPRHRQPGHTVVAVAQNLDPHALVVLRTYRATLSSLSVCLWSHLPHTNELDPYLRQLVEASKQLVQRGNELRRGQLLRQGREVDDVGVENTAATQPKLG